MKRVFWWMEWRRRRVLLGEMHFSHSRGFLSFLSRENPQFCWKRWEKSLKAQPWKQIDDLGLHFQPKTLLRLSKQFNQNSISSFQNTQKGFFFFSETHGLIFSERFSEKLCDRQKLRCVRLYGECFRWDSTVENLPKFPDNSEKFKTYPPKILLSLQCVIIEMFIYFDVKACYKARWSVANMSSPLLRKHHIEKPTSGIHMMSPH